MDKNLEMHNGISRLLDVWNMLSRLKKNCKQIIHSDYHFSITSFSFIVILFYTDTNLISIAKELCNIYTFL